MWHYYFSCDNLKVFSIQINRMHCGVKLQYNLNRGSQGCDRNLQTESGDNGARPGGGRACNTVRSNLR